MDPDSPRNRGGYSRRRIRGQIVARVEEPAKGPEALGKPLIGELTGHRAVRAASQRYRIIYRVERQVVTVLVVAVGRRKEGDRKDIYELARRLLRQRLLGGRVSPLTLLSPQRGEGEQRSSEGRGGDSL